MEYQNNGLLKLEYKIPRYSAKILVFDNRKNVALDSISLSFPFGVNIQIKPVESEIKIAREVIIKLIDRRILNAAECCAECIQRAIDSLKEIKADLIDIKCKLTDNINRPIYYFIDYIVLSINSFLDFIERYKIDMEMNRPTYFDALEKLRRHIAKCMVEISKIGECKIDTTHYAFKNNAEWIYDNYSVKTEKEIDINV